jgi:hypothetical protein
MLAMIRTGLLGLGQSQGDVDALGLGVFVDGFHGLDAEHVVAAVQHEIGATHLVEPRSPLGSLSSLLLPHSRKVSDRDKNSLWDGFIKEREWSVKNWRPVVIDDLYARRISRLGDGWRQSKGGDWKVSHSNFNGEIVITKQSGNSNRELP